MNASSSLHFYISLVGEDLIIITTKIQISNCEFDGNTKPTPWNVIEDKGRDLLCLYVQMMPEKYSSEGFSNAQLYKLYDLLRYNRGIIDILAGSIIVKMTLPTLEAAHDLWNMFTTEELKKVYEVMLVPFLSQTFGLSLLELDVTVSEEEYHTACRNLQKRKPQNVTVNLPRAEPSNTTVNLLGPVPASAETQLPTVSGVPTSQNIDQPNKVDVDLGRLIL